MKISRFIAKLKLFLAIFIVPPKIWQLPKKSEVLIYDATGAEIIMPFLINYSVNIIHIRGELINVPCFFLSMLSLSFWKGNTLTAYVESYIEVISPKVMITYIDNNTSFFEISKRFPDLKTVFVQNATRGQSGDIFEKLVKSDNYLVDYMLVHGTAIGKYYSNFISGQFIPIGALKNNAVPQLNSVDSENVLFISQWHNKSEVGAPFYIEYDGTAIYWDVFFEAEVKVLRFLDKWCTENNKRLTVCGREEKNDGPENFFYANQLYNCAWEYVPKTSIYSSYQLVDAAEIVVYIDSTLGYESIGRGKKTAAFSCRESSIGSEATKFGWPAVLPNNGPFWTNEQDESQFQRVMDYLNKISDKQWQKVCQTYARELMEFDPGNKRFAILLDQLIPR